MRKIFDVLHSLRKWYWRTFRIKTFGVRVLITNGILVFLVKNRYGDLWVFPGGKMKELESVKSAAMREVKEETNIEIVSFEKILGRYANRQQGRKNDTVTVLVTNDWIDHGRKWNWEIKEGGFFDINHLPVTTSSATRRRIAEYFSKEDRDFSGEW